MKEQVIKQETDGLRGQNEKLVNDWLRGQNEKLVNDWTRRLEELEKENEILNKVNRKMAEDIFRIVLMVDIGGSDKFVNVESVVKHYRDKMGK